MKRRNIPQKEENRPKRKSTPKKTLDRFPEEPKKKRGRPGLNAEQVLGTADHNRMLLENVWDRLQGPLLAAQSEDDVTKAFEGVDHHARYKFVPHLSKLILRVIREKRFPKRRDAQIKFLADSVAAGTMRSPRRSRDICMHERLRTRQFIIRRDYYIECTCGYEGPAKNGACQKCGTKETHISIMSDDYEFGFRY